MALSIGIVGLPNVGKSTLFKALTKIQVDISNYPFCTISPNVGCVKVPDFRLEELAKVLNPQKIIPTAVEFIDIAGLVRGAHRGEGLGNEFLSQIRGTEAICHLVRFFSSPQVSHIEGKTDPLRDIEIVHLELILSDLEIIERHLPSLEQKMKTFPSDKELKTKVVILKKIKESLEKEKFPSLSEKEKEAVKEYNFLTLKPVFYLLNVDEEEFKKDFSLEKFISLHHLSNFINPSNSLALSVKLESELQELEEKEIKEYLKEFNLKESGLNLFIKKIYQFLDLITFFTQENNILQAWTVKKETKAPQAAGKIHSDFERGFVAVEVINWQDLIRLGGKEKAKEKGMLRLWGKDYLIQDGDVCRFHFNL